MPFRPGPTSPSPEPKSVHADEISDDELDSRVAQPASGVLPRPLSTIRRQARQPNLVQRSSVFVSCVSVSRTKAPCALGERARCEFPVAIPPAEDASSGGSPTIQLRALHVPPARARNRRHCE